MTCIPDATGGFGWHGPGCIATPKMVFAPMRAGVQNCPHVLTIADDAMATAPGDAVRVACMLKKRDLSVK